MVWNLGLRYTRAAHGLDLSRTAQPQSDPTVPAFVAPHSGVAAAFAPLVSFVPPSLPPPTIASESRAAEAAAGSCHLLAAAAAIDNALAAAGLANSNASMALNRTIAPTPMNASADVDGGIAEGAEDGDSTGVPSQGNADSDVEGSNDEDDEEEMVMEAIERGLEAEQLQETAAA